MPGPFPGMDPYLEDPLRFPGLHAGLITAISAQLNLRLPDEYVSDINERVHIETNDGEMYREIYPDVYVSKRLEQPSESSGGVLLADPSILIAPYEVELTEAFIEILAIGENRRVVTTIEILSPTNKRSGTNGRELYLKKQRQLLGGDVHLVEIDLLRNGAHTVSVRRDDIPLSAGRWDYLVLLNRAGKPRKPEAWPFRMRNVIPRVRIPLLGDDPDVVLDLQACFDRVYEESAYSRKIDYREAPRIRLRDDDAAWADALLCEKGLRKPS